MIFFCIPGPDDQNRWNRKNCPKFFHRVIFALWIQIYNPNLCKSHIFWSTANIQKWPKLVKSEKLPKFFHRVFFAFWIQICNQNLWKYHTFWNTAYIEKWFFFAFQDLMTKIDEIEKIARNFFHRVIYAFWIKICNSNLCKSHIFWITANIEKWSFFAYPDLMTKIDEIGKIARNSFIG